MVLLWLWCSIQFEWRKSCWWKGNWSFFWKIDGNFGGFSKKKKKKKKKQQSSAKKIGFLNLFISINQTHQQTHIDIHAHTQSRTYTFTRIHCQTHIYAHTHSFLYLHSQLGLPLSSHSHSYSYLLTVILILDKCGRWLNFYQCQSITFGLLSVFIKGRQDIYWIIKWHNPTYWHNFLVFSCYLLQTKFSKVSELRRGQAMSGRPKCGRAGPQLRPIDKGDKEVIKFCRLWQASDIA